MALTTLRFWHGMDHYLHAIIAPKLLFPKICPFKHLPCRIPIPKFESVAVFKLLARSLFLSPTPDTHIKPISLRALVSSWFYSQNYYYPENSRPSLQPSTCNLSPNIAG